jgi:FtsP/CotA-like multicopper oxidase with cupredoxin domain
MPAQFRPTGRAVRLLRDLNGTYGKVKERRRSTEHGMARPEHPPSATPSPRNLLVVLFVAGAICAGAVGYLGATDRIGGTIPGTYPGNGSAPTCEGRSAVGTYSFTFVAGIAGRLNFNGSVPGPCAIVGAGSNVTVTLTIATDAGTNHSWDLIPASGPTNVSPVFPGAGFVGASRFVGIAPGTSETFHFTATTAGAYRYVCEMPGHAAAGMYGSFTVVSPATSPAATAGPARGPGLPAVRTEGISR